MSAGVERRCGEGDEGSVLVLALVFLTVFGLLIGAVLAQTEVNLKTTSVVRSRAQRSYAADGGVEWAMAQIRVDATYCTGSSTSTQTINGRQVTVTCQAVSGDVLGARGYAVIITDTGTLSKQSGGSPTINGPVFANGAIEIQGDDLIVTNGSVDDKFGSCSGPSAPARLSVSPDPPYRWRCTEGPTPALAPVLPTVPPTAPPFQTIGSCRVFYPGKYTTAPNLAGDNYFVSGIYYFENIGTWTVPNNTTIVAGNPRLPEMPSLAATPCSSDVAAGGGSGFGVEWIFGGSSALQVKNNTSVELFTRFYGVGESSYTERVSIYAVPATGSGYQAAAAGLKVVEVSTGGAGLVVHGLVYAPENDIDLFASNGAVANFQDGVVARNLALQASNVGNGLAVSVATSNNVRSAVITATAASPDEATVVSRALVDIRNTTSPPEVVVASWRTG